MPTEAVVSSKNGMMYEKRLIMKHLAEEGKCPVSGVFMSDQDLITVRGALTHLFSICASVEYVFCAKYATPAHLLTI